MESCEELKKILIPRFNPRDFYLVGMGVAKVNQNLKANKQNSQKVVICSEKLGTELYNKILLLSTLQIIAVPLWNVP